MNQLLLPIIGDVDPSNIEVSTKEEAVEAKLKKGMSGNAKLSHWVGVFSKASNVVCYVAFVAFWLYKFIFWLLSSLRCKTSLLLISNKDFCWVESAIGLYVSSSSVYAVRYFVK